MMARGRWRAIQDGEQTTPREPLRTEEESFMGFEQGDIVTSTPRRMGALRDLLGREEISVNDGSITQEEFTVLKFCSTCGSQFNDHNAQCSCDTQDW